MAVERDTGHNLNGIRIPRLTHETYLLYRDERQETLYNLSSDPKMWLAGALALADVQELDIIAEELGLIPSIPITQKPAPIEFPKGGE